MAYDAEYYRAHKEKIAVSKHRYYLRHKAERAAHAKELRIWNAWQSPGAEKNRAMGAAIRTWRNAVGVTQVELAKCLGVSTPIISTYETGASPAKPERFKKIPSLYGILKEKEKEYGA